MNPTTLTRSMLEASSAAAPAAPPRGAGRAQRLWRGSPEDPAWARPALIGLLVATAAFYLYNLTASGWANSFYSAAVQAGSTNWEAFFFGSSDAANSITVDKPPASLWIMALSVKVFGLSSFSVLFPQVVMGVAGVGVLYATVRKNFGVQAGLIAGAVLALTPVAVLMFRFNNPDALLTFLMVLAAWATMKSIEKTSPKWFMIVGVFIGLAFLTKTLQAFLVVPGFALAYLVAARTSLLKRIWHVILGGLAIVVSAGWWVAIVELLPDSVRPYIGGSQTNSFLELTFGYNGLGRITGDETGSVGGGGGNWGSTGLGRMFNAEIGGQISWLIPAALILLAAGLYFRGRRPRTDTRRAAYLVWGAWLVVTGLTFSLMAGIFHAYYTVALAPAVAALVGMGAAEAWERRDRAMGAITLAVATAATAVWGFVLLSRSVEWNSWLRIVVLAVGLAAALGFLVVSADPPTGGPRRGRRRALRGAARACGLLGPDRVDRPLRLDRRRRSDRGWGHRRSGRRYARRPGSRRCDAGRWHRHRRPWRRGRHGRPAQRRDPEHRRRLGAVGERRPVHLGRGGHRLPERGRPADRLRSCRSWPSAASTAATRRRRWPSSRSTCRPGRSTTSSPVAASAASRTAAATPRRRSRRGSSRTSPP